MQRRLLAEARPGFADGYGEGIRFAVRDLREVLIATGVVRPARRAGAFRVR